MSKDKKTIKETMQLLENSETNPDDIAQQISNEILQGSDQDVLSIIEEKSIEYGMSVEEIEQAFERVYGHDPYVHKDKVDEKPDNDEQRLEDAAKKVHRELNKDFVFDEQEMERKRSELIKQYADWEGVNEEDLDKKLRNEFENDYYDDESLYEFIGMGEKQKQQPNKMQLIKKAKDLALNIWEKGEKSTAKEAAEAAISILHKKYFVDVKDAKQKLNVRNLLTVDDITQKMMNPNESKKVLSFKSFLLRENYDI